jgi:hypothetical protein
VRINLTGLPRTLQSVNGIAKSSNEKEDDLAGVIYGATDSKRVDERILCYTPSFAVSEASKHRSNNENDCDDDKKFGPRDPD